MHHLRLSIQLPHLLGYQQYSMHLLRHWLLREQQRSVRFGLPHQLYRVYLSLDVHPVRIRVFHQPSRSVPALYV